MKIKINVAMTGILAAGCVFAAGTPAVTSNAAPADELARRKEASSEIPTAPEGYSRPANWKPLK